MTERGRQSSREAEWTARRVLRQIVHPEGELVVGTRFAVNRRAAAGNEARRADSCAAEGQLFESRRDVRRLEDPAERDGSGDQAGGDEGST